MSHKVLFTDVKEAAKFINAPHLFDVQKYYQLGENPTKECSVYVECVGSKEEVQNRAVQFDGVFIRNFDEYGNEVD